MRLDRSAGREDHRAVVILHASRDFVTRFKCQVSLPDQRDPQSAGLDAWSAHVIRLGRSPVILVMNDASLYTLLVPAAGLTEFADFVRILMMMIRGVWSWHGVSFDGAQHPVAVIRSTNRSLIGSMNDAARMIRWRHDLCREEDIPFDLAFVQGQLNDNPYKAIGYRQPKEVLARLLSLSPP